MGYTTKFAGVFKLSRKLTLNEAAEMLAFNEDPGKFPEKLKSYMQWVPTADLDGICWDEGEKFYYYIESGNALLSWLSARGISAQGEVVFHGEDFSDAGVVRIVDGRMVAITHGENSKQNYAPLTHDALNKMLSERAA